MSSSFFIQELAGVPIWWYLVGAGLVAGPGLAGLLRCTKPPRAMDTKNPPANENTFVQEPKVGPATAVQKVTAEPEPKKQKALPNEVQLKRSSALRRATGAGDTLPTLADELILSAEATQVEQSTASRRRRAKNLV